MIHIIADIVWRAAIGEIPRQPEFLALAEMRSKDPTGLVLDATTRLAHVDAEPSSLAYLYWVRGLARHELALPDEALTDYGTAIDLARVLGLRDCESRARASRAISLLSIGRSAEAISEIGEALRMSPSSTRPVIEMLAGLLHQRQGRVDQALAAYRGALVGLRRVGDQPAIARLFLNRGILHAYQWNLGAAVDDFEQAEQIAQGAQLWLLGAQASHNLGFAKGRQGDVPGALQAFDAALSVYTEFAYGSRFVPVLMSDRAEVLLMAGLNEEAVEAAAAARQALALTSDRIEIAETSLLLARALLACGRLHEAALEANAVAADCRAGRRRAWAALADHVAVQAELRLVDRDLQDGFSEAGSVGSLLKRMGRVSRELDQLGWLTEAAQVQTELGRVLLRLGRVVRARAAMAAGRAALRSGPASLRSQAWYAEALLRRTDGDLPAARRALRRGLTIVEEHGRTLGATELRTRSAVLGVDLAKMGLSMALESRRVDHVFWWTERWRANALLRRPVRPPDDSQLASLLIELRQLNDDLRHADVERVAESSARLARLEREVRDTTLQAHSHAGLIVATPTLRALRQRMGDRVLIEYIDVEGHLYALAVTASATRLVDLGPTEPVRVELQYALSALRGLGMRGGHLDIGSSRLLSAFTTVQRLAELLIAPIGAGSAELVVVPTGILHAVPWGALPELAGRPVTVSPSATLWMRTRQPSARSGVLLVAGPDLEFADSEVASIAGFYPDAIALTGGAATAAAVMERLSGSRIVHIAAHGKIRHDSPLFSSLQLANGPLTLFDLESVVAPPHTVLLPACDGAVTAVRSGDELLGAPAALLSAGVVTVIAPLVPVPDEATAALMVAVHRRLAEGQPAAQALSDAAQERRSTGSVADLLAAGAFICVGCDERPIS